MVIDLIKDELSESLLHMCIRTLRSEPQAQWLVAWEFRGLNSTIKRRNAIEALYGQYVPYFRIDDPHSIRFIKDVRAEVETAIQRAETRVNATAGNQTLKAKANEVRAVTQNRG